ncbi:MAG TPA: hypothetical protein VFP35_00655 [Candidatus Saccharimonadales bacterium]|nr:hypothetical protein [Candidatus Saccharimonadales bacterium]
MADGVILLLILVPAFLTYFLRSNGAIVFLSVCAGFTSASLAGNEVASTLSSANLNLRSTDVDLLFMFLPMAFSVFLTARSVSGKAKTTLHAIAAGVAGALFVVAGAPFLNISLHLGLDGTHIWSPLRSAESYLAAGGSLYSLVLIWFFSKNRHASKNKH